MKNVHTIFSSHATPGCSCLHSQGTGLRRLASASHAASFFLLISSISFSRSRVVISVTLHFLQHVVHNIHPRNDLERFFHAFQFT